MYTTCWEMAQDAVAATAPDLVNETAGGAGTLAVEIVHAASHEGAPHVEGVLIRRTRLYLEAGDRGLAAAGPAAELMAGALGWEARERDSQVAWYRQRVQAELMARAAPDDDGGAAKCEVVGDPRLTPIRPWRKDSLVGR